eukprot:1446764-Prorocentrum_lima.AAC.1
MPSFLLGVGRLQHTPLDMALQDRLARNAHRMSSSKRGAKCTVSSLLPGTAGTSSSHADVVDFNAASADMESSGDEAAEGARTCHVWSPTVENSACTNAVGNR